MMNACGLRQSERPRLDLHHSIYGHDEVLPTSQCSHVACLAVAVGAAIENHYKLVPFPVDPGLSPSVNMELQTL